MSKKTEKNNSKEGFVQVSQLLLQSIAFTPAEKLIIAYLNSWNNSTGSCYETNPQLAVKLNMGLSTIKDAIKKLTGLKILSKFTENRLDSYKKIYTHREISLNEAKLEAYLIQVEEERDAQLLVDAGASVEIKKEKKELPVVEKTPVKTEHVKLSKQNPEETLFDFSEDNIKTEKRGSPSSRPMVDSAGNITVEGIPDTTQLEANTELNEVDGYFTQIVEEIKAKGLKSYATKRNPNPSLYDVLKDRIDEDFYFYSRIKKETHHKLHEVVCKKAQKLMVVA